MQYTGKIQLKIESEIQEFDANIDLMNSIISIQTASDTNISFDLNHPNGVGINSKDNLYKLVSYSIIKDKNNLFILGQIKERESEILLFEVFIYFMNIQVENSFSKIYWVTRESTNENLVDIVKFNRQRNYQQGGFANNLNRNDIYNLVRNISTIDSFKNFLTKTLEWGDYNTVVADRYNKPNSNDAINNIENISDYKEIFTRELEKEKISIKKLFNKFRRGELNIKGVEFSYFTKFLHFYSYGMDLPCKLLILDKWAQFAWATLLIEENKDEKKELIKSLYSVDEKGKIKPKQISGDKYEQYNMYIKNIAEKNKIPANQFEELMFGWRKDEIRNSFINPRLHIEKVLIDFYNH